MFIALVVTLYAVWSSAFSIGKLALAFSPPVFLTGFRMILAGTILLGYLGIAKRSSFKLEKNKWLCLLLLGFFSVYLANILEFWGLQYLSAAKTSFIYSLSPFFTALFSYIHFKEKMNGKKWIGLTIGFLGFIPVLMTQTGSEELFSVAGFLSWPTIALMGAALTAVYGWVLLRLILKNSEITPVMANGTSMLFGGVIALVHSFFIDSWSPIPVTEGHLYSMAKIVFILTVLSNIICYNLFGMMLKRFTATFLSFMGLLSPIFASITGWIFLGEPISWIIFLSTGIVSMGLWIVYYVELKQGYIIRKSPKTEEKQLEEA